MNALGTDRESDVESIVDDDGHREAAGQLPSDATEIPRTGLLEPQLHHGGAAPDRGLTRSDEIATLKDPIVGDGNEPERLRERGEHGYEEASKCAKTARAASSAVSWMVSTITSGATGAS